MPVAPIAGWLQMWTLRIALQKETKTKLNQGISSFLWNPGRSTPSWWRPSSRRLTSTRSTEQRAKSFMFAPTLPVSLIHFSGEWSRNVIHVTGPLVFCLHLCSVSGPCSGSAPRRPFPRSLALTGCRVQSLCARQCTCCQHVLGTRTDQTGPFFPGRFVNGVYITRSCRNQEPLLPTGRIMTSLAHRSPWCLVSSRQLPF